MSRTLVLPGTRETDLVPLMETLTSSHSGVAFSSDPKFVEGGTELHLRLSGTHKLVDKVSGTL